MKKSIQGILLFAALLFVANPAVGAVWYVDSLIGTSGDGTTWGTAFATIQEAIDAASAGDEAWVKAGTYTLSATINLDEEVSLYGGFAGAETSREERDWETNVTTIDGNDAVRCLYVTADNVTIDGFTVTGGYTDGTVVENGAAMQNGLYGGGEIDTTVANCVFTDNHSGRHAGAIYNDEGNLALDNCVFAGNTASNRGGAILSYSIHSNNITNCEFTDNSGRSGGAMVISDDSVSNTVTNTTFIGNTADTDGGAIVCDADINITGCIFLENIASRYGTIATYADPGKTIAVVNSTFANNSVQYGGGVCINGSSGELGAVIIKHCTFTGNTATGDGGAVLSRKALGPTSVFLVSNSILWGDSGNEIAVIDNGELPTVIYSDVDQDGYEGSKGNIREDPLFVGVDDFHLAAGSPCVDMGTDANVADDIDGDLRPLLTGFDMGADEYTGACWDLDSDTYISEQCGGDDCDDGNAGVNPGGVEECGQATCSDGLDNDCDGLTDMGDPDCLEWCAYGTQASTIQTGRAYSTGPVNAMVILLVPLAGILFWKTTRRRRK